MTECFLLPLCVRSSTTFPLDGLYPLNWTNFPPKSTHQQKLLRDCYQNNTTAEKEALNDVIREKWRRNSTNFPASTCDNFLTKLIGTRKHWEKDFSYQLHLYFDWSSPLTLLLDMSAKTGDELIEMGSTLLALTKDQILDIPNSAFISAVAEISKIKGFTSEQLKAWASKAKSVSVITAVTIMHGPRSSNHDGKFLC